MLAQRFEMTLQDVATDTVVGRRAAAWRTYHTLKADVLDLDDRLKAMAVLGADNRTLTEAGAEYWRALRRFSEHLTLMDLGGYTTFAHMEHATNAPDDLRLLVWGDHWDSALDEADDIATERAAGELW